MHKFNSTFSLSRLQDAIDGVDTNAIVGSETAVRLQRRITPTLSTATNYTINFNVPLHRGTVTNKLTSFLLTQKSTLIYPEPICICLIGLERPDETFISNYQTNAVHLNTMTCFFNISVVGKG